MKKNNQKKNRRLFAKRQKQNSRNCQFETMEARALLTASSLSTGTGADIESTGPFSTYMPVGSGPNSYSGFSSFGFVDVPVSGLALNSGVSSLNSLTLNLDNTATSGKFAPTAGSFAVYFVPNETTPASSMRFQGGQAGTNTDLAAIGTTTGGASTLGIGATDLVGTFSITSSLPAGYTGFTFNSLGTGAQTGIANDINNNQDIRLIVVSEDNTGKADWEGNFTSGNPQVSVDANEAPLVSFTGSTFQVTENSTGSTTTATISVHRSGNPNTPLTIHYATSDGTAHQPTDYTATSGNLTWAAGDTTDKTFTVSFNNITTTDPFRTVNLTLSDAGGNPIAPVFPTTGTTATAQINYLQAGNVSIDSGSYSVDEAAGTVAITIDRSGTSAAMSQPASVTLTTVNGVPYVNGSLQMPDDAQAGRDFGTAGNSTAPSFVVNFTGTTSLTQQVTINVPILDVKTFAGSRFFSASLTNPSNGTGLGTTSQTTVTVTDDAVANSDTPTGSTTESLGVETSGPFGVNTYAPVVSTPHGSFGFTTFPFYEFADGSAGAGASITGGPSAVFPTTYSVATVDSVKLSIDNTATTGGFGGTAGGVDVYFLADDTFDASTLKYEGGIGATGATVIGTQASPTLLGTAFFPNNQVGYNDFVFDDLPSNVASALTADLNSGSPIRFAVVPHDTSVAADWEGNFTSNQPQLTLLVEKSSQPVDTFNLDTASAVVDKTAGVIHVTVDRSASDGNLSQSATIQYSTANGAVGGLVGANGNYNASVGLAGTDYGAVGNTAGVTGTATFDPGSSQTSFDIPILNDVAEAGDKNFTITIDNPNAGAGTIANIVGISSEIVAIRDEQTIDVFQNASDDATVQPAGPRTGTTGKSFFNVEANNSANGANTSFGVLDYNQGSISSLPFSLPSPVGTINEVSISTVTGFPPSSFQHSGTFNVYLVDDSTTSDNNDGSSPLTFNTTADPLEGVGTQLGTKHLLGTINYNSNQPTDVFTSFPLTNADAATLALLANDLNSGAKFRIVVTPGDSAVAASWEGQASFNGLFESPILSFNYTTGTTAALPTWLSPSSEATWDGHTLTVTGSATIIADPGADEPLIVGSGAAAQLTIAPTNGDHIIHVGGVTLTDGASLTMASVGVGRSHTNHDALVVGVLNGAAPTFSIDSSSKLDLADNDLVVHQGDLANLQALASEGRNVASGGFLDGTWTGNGLTSSAAASVDASVGFEQNALAVVQNGDLPFGPYSDWQLGLQDEALGSGDILVKYTYTGDFELDGAVDDSAAIALGAFYDNGATTGHSWSDGDTNGDGKIDDTDAIVLGALFGNGISNGTQL
jgi:hypothetical protein